MTESHKKFTARIPELDLSEGPDMLTDFSREAQRHLIAARNALLILETVPTDKDAIEDIFKTFHTIKGLAQFLQLLDIYAITSAAESLMDQSRKDVIHLGPDLIPVVVEAIAVLQKLLELLDEQLANDGKLKSEYYDAGTLVETIRNITEKSADAVRVAKPAGKILPTINYEPDMSTCAQLEEHLRKAPGEVTSETKLVANLIKEFQETSKELKLVQSKLQERHRELIKERELAIKLTQQAQEDARTKSEYLANMSHEIRTLINAILGFTELLKEGGLNPKQKEHLNTIIMSGRMLLQIVNDILDFSKVESGKLKLEKIPFNLDRIVEEVFKIIRSRLAGKPVNLYYHIEPNVPRDLIGDPTRMKQIFINLIDNAIKFTEQGEIGLTVSVPKNSEGASSKQELTFVVQDTGIGIPKDRQQVVFDTFTQAHDSTTRLYGGSGLGLALVKNFVEKMGGKIWIDSEVGAGSRFIFTIAFESSPKGASGLAPESMLQNFRGIEVLIVDSHETSSRSLVAFLEKVPFEVLSVARTAKQASEFLLKRWDEKKTLPRLIFIDLLLPSKEGYMLAYRLRQQEIYNPIKLISLSSDVKAESLPDYHQAGFDILLATPIIPHETADVIQRVLGDGDTANRSFSDDDLGKISCAGISILVAEDSVPNRELLKIHFETLGCTCDFATNGVEAIDFLKKNKYDICFMDLQMPKMGGLEASRFIRQELGLKLPIVALTAAEQEEEKGRCLLAGITDYLAKPFGIDELKRKIITCTKI